MPVKAIWHTPDLVVDNADPFDEPAEIEQVGTPIVLTADGDRAELNAELVRSVEREARLFDEGVSCRIKDGQGSSCHACPLFRDDDSPEAKLCAIGRQQERLCTRLLVIAHGG